MKKTTFYIIAGVLAIALIFLFCLSVELTNPFLIAAAFIGSVIILLILRKHVDGVLTDERQTLIDMRASTATIRAAAVLFITVNLATAVYVFSESFGFHAWLNHSAVPRAESLGLYPPFAHAPPSQIPISDLGGFAILQLILLVLTVFIYVGAQIHYTRKYGAVDDEE